MGASALTSAASVVVQHIILLILQHLQKDPNVLNPIVVQVV